LDSEEKLIHSGERNFFYPGEILGSDSKEKLIHPEEEK
jgi:hypothetical protein